MFFIDSISPVKNYFSEIAYSGENIVLSLEGMKAYAESNHDFLDLRSGRYSLVYRDDAENTALVLTDPTGQDILFFYQDDNYWAVSNSFYRLIEGLKANRIETEIYFPALYSQKIKHSLGAQPLSNNTLVKHVKILPRDHYILIKNNELTKNKRIYNSPKISTIQDYKEQLSQVIMEQISVLNILVGLLPEGSIRCDLSGGMDSRVVFGICNHLDDAQTKIKFSSNPRLEEDYFIAQKLAHYFNIKLNNASLGDYKKTIKEVEQFELYKYGNVGIYNSIYKPNYKFTPRTLHVHGAGGESLRGQYQGSPRQIIARLKNHFSSNEEFELVQNEFFSYFSEKGLDINDPRSMLDHSRCFRSRFHFGRNWFRSLTNPLYTPLSDIRLEELADYLNKVCDDSTIIFYDIYMLLDDLLAFFPFDEQEKNLDLSKLKSTHIALTKKMNKKSMVEFSVYGEFSENRVDVKSVQESISKLSFDEQINIEKDLFVENYPTLEVEYTRMSYLHSVLNALVK